VPGSAQSRRDGPAGQRSLQDSTATFQSQPEHAAEMAELFGVF